MPLVLLGSAYAVLQLADQKATQTDGNFGYWQLARLSLFCEPMLVWLIAIVCYTIRSLFEVDRNESRSPQPADVGVATFFITGFYQLVVLSLRYSFFKWVIGLLVGIILISLAANFETRR